MQYLATKETFKYIWYVWKSGLIGAIKRDWKQQSHKMTSELAATENETFPKPETKAENFVN